MDKIDIMSLDITELEELIIELGEKKYRATEIFSFLHEKLVDDFSSMTSLSKSFRENLEAKCFITKIEILRKIVSEKDGTQKYLFKINDKHIVESVLMSYKFGYSVCVSSQVGCKMGCTFCASAVNGFISNLKPSEMLAQIYAISRDINNRISNVVLMGSGEPFDNYLNVIKFIRLLNHHKGLNIGQRHITVSTCGLANKIIEFAKEDIQVNLAISLHAANDELRIKTMPIAKKYSINEIMEACKFYTNKTKRRITFEYALISGHNDSVSDAMQLSRLLRNTLSYVNLIPINEVSERNYKKTSLDNIKSFAKILNDNNIETTIRRELGSDINAACGQLRNEFTE